MLISTAFADISGLTLYSAERDHEHPNPVSRLERFQRKYLPEGGPADPAPMALAVAASALELHLQHAKGFDYDKQWPTFTAYFAEARKQFD